MKLSSVKTCKNETNTFSCKEKKSTENLKRIFVTNLLYLKLLD